LVLVDDGPLVRNEDEELEITHLLDDPLYLVLAPDHPLAKRQRIRFQDLASEPWIAGTQICACTRHLHAACAAAGFEPRQVFESDDFQVVQGLVAAGVGVALIPGLGLASERPDVVIRSLGAKPPARQILAATLKGSYRSPATAEMIETLKRIGAEYGAKQRPELAAAS